MHWEAVEITGSHIGDAPVASDLLGQIPADEQIGSISADGACDTRRCHDAVANRSAHAIIPPRKKAKPRETAAAGALAKPTDQGWTTARRETRLCAWRWSGYHRRGGV